MHDALSVAVAKQNAGGAPRQAGALPNTNPAELYPHRLGDTGEAAASDVPLPWRALGVEV